MEDNELYKIAQVIYNKIYTENIIYITDLAQEQKPYENAVLKENISISDIVNAIQKEQDLNNLNNINLMNYINTDLNEFLLYVCKMREIGLDHLIKMVHCEDVYNMQNWIFKLIACFTVEEALIIKKVFLKKIINCLDIDNLSAEGVENLFAQLITAINEEMSQKLDKKL